MRKPPTIRSGRVVALVDIDGTLTHGRPVAHGHAIVGSLSGVFGVRVTERDLLSLDLAGRTDLRIARELLRRAGVSARTLDERRAEWCRSAEAHYHALADHHPSPAVAPDAAHALTRLRDAGVALALVTGNIEGIARHKMARAGLGEFFPTGQGAFGGEAAERVDLVRNAVARAGCAPHEAVVVGDTPRDIAAARGAGCRVVAVSTGWFDAAALKEADVVASNLTQAADHLLGEHP